MLIANGQRFPIANKKGAGIPPRAKASGSPARRLMDKEVLGGTDGKARCNCGKLRYPRYPICPKCYYEGPQKPPKKLSREELLKMQTPKRMPLADRQERIQFLQKRYGTQLRGKDIRYMKNAQVYALSEQAGYRRK